MTTVLETYVSRIRSVENLKIDKKYSKEGTYPVAAPDHVVGVELEIENVPNPKPDMVLYTATGDGSLRNNGVEFLTTPNEIKYLEHTLTKLFTTNNIKPENYSDRCSTHVHFNCQDLTWEQVITVCLIYQTVERLLFKYIGDAREENIYCVPWYQANMTSQFVESMKNPDVLVRYWQKYTALNLLPLRNLGTLEFRHLYGTCDVKQILDWVNIISRMFNYAKASSLEKTKNTILEMNTVSNYAYFMEDVFKNDAILLKVPDWREELATGVIDSKLMLVKKKETKLAKIEKALDEVNARAIEGENHRFYVELRQLAQRDDLDVQAAALRQQNTIAGAEQRIRDAQERLNREYAPLADLVAGARPQRNRNPR